MHSLLMKYLEAFLKIEFSPTSAEPDDEKRLAFKCLSNDFRDSIGCYLEGTLKSLWEGISLTLYPCADLRVLSAVISRKGNRLGNAFLPFRMEDRCFQLDLLLPRETMGFQLYLLLGGETLPMLGVGSIPTEACPFQIIEAYIRAYPNHYREDFDSGAECA